VSKSHVARQLAEAAADPDAFDLYGDPEEDDWFLKSERAVLAHLEALARR